MPPKPNETYDQIGELISQIKEQQWTQTRLAVLENDMENYVKETEIHKMIAKKIKKHEDDEEKIDKNGIQWSAIIQQLVIQAVTVLITYYLVKGASA